MFLIFEIFKYFKYFFLLNVFLNYKIKVSVNKVTLNSH